MPSPQILFALHYSADMMNVKDKKIMRKRIVDYATDNGIKPAAAKYAISKNTVRLWQRRYKSGGYDSQIGRAHV